MIRSEHSESRHTDKNKLNKGYIICDYNSIFEDILYMLSIKTFTQKLLCLRRERIFCGGSGSLSHHVCTECGHMVCSPCSCHSVLTCLLLHKGIYHSYHSAGKGQNKLSERTGQQRGQSFIHMSSSSDIPHRIHSMSKQSLHDNDRHYRRHHHHRHHHQLHVTIIHM